MLRSWMLFGCLTTILLLAQRSDAQVYQRFELDPVRSFIQFESGEVSGQLGENTFPYAPLTAQPGMGPVPLYGHMLLRIDPDLTTPLSVATVSGTTDLRMVNRNTASPGLGAVPGTTGPAAFGLAFQDPLVGVGGEAALRDLIFALTTSLDIFPNALGDWGLRGTFGLIQVRGRYDLDFDFGIDASAGVGTKGPLFTGFVFSDSTQLEQVSPGIYEIRLPFETNVGSFEIPGAITGATGLVVYSGEIVATTAVPEPTLGLGMLAGGAMLLGLSRRRTRR